MNFKILIYLLIAIVFTSNSYAVKTYKKGKGSLNLSENTAHVLEYYFSGGTKGKWAEPEKADWNPYVIAISEDGHYFGIIRQPKKFASQNVDQKNYSALAIGDCKKMAKNDGYPQECFLFAFIDGGHSYQTTLNDLEIVYKNMKGKKGTIVCDDYQDASYITDVKKAIDDYVKKESLSLRVIEGKFAVIDF